MDSKSSDGPPPAPAIGDRPWAGDGVSSAVEYDSDTGVYRTSFARSTESVPLAVVSTVAMVAETPPTELPPLQSVLDTQALEQIADPNTPGSRTRAEVSFRLDDHTVTVYNDGVISVRPPESS